MRTVTATRYVTPLREGGSMPGLVEADDDGLYVLKFRGAGQGGKVLATELMIGEVARRIGLPIPEIVLIELDPVLGHAEPDPEIQELISASAGLNLAMDFLPGALALDETACTDIDPDLAAAIVWLDALAMNVDRTPRNPNLLVWHHGVWLIDHGASMYPQYRSGPLADHAGNRFAAIADHVLLPHAASITAADARLAPMLDEPFLRELAATIPALWLEGAQGGEATPARGYADFVLARLQAPRDFVDQAEAARLARRADGPARR